MSKVTRCRSRTITAIRTSSRNSPARDQKAARPCAMALSLETSAAPCAPHVLPACTRVLRTSPQSVPVCPARPPGLHALPACTCAPRMSSLSVPGQSRGAVPQAHASTTAKGSFFPLGFWKRVPSKGEGHRPSCSYLYAGERGGLFQRGEENP